MENVNVCECLLGSYPNERNKVVKYEKSCES